MLVGSTDSLGTIKAPAKRRGRPKSAVSKTASVVAEPVKRILSAEGRARIAEAQKARWAEGRQATKPSTSTDKKTTPEAAKKAVTKRPRKTAAPAEKTRAAKAVAPESTTEAAVSES